MTSIDGVTIVPEAPTAITPLTCTHSGFVDADGDGDASTVSWFVDGAYAGSGPVLGTGFSRGQTVRCEVTPNDGRDAGEARTQTTVIGNAAPSIGAVLDGL